MPIYPQTLAIPGKKTREKKKHAIFEPFHSGIERKRRRSEGGARVKDEERKHEEVIRPDDLLHVVRALP